jgi:hypothetical protein
MSDLYRFSKKAIDLRLSCFIKLFDNRREGKPKSLKEVGGKRSYRLSPYVISAIARIYRFRLQEKR